MGWCTSSGMYKDLCITGYLSTDAGFLHINSIMSFPESFPIELFHPFQMLILIGSMYGIFTYIWLIFMVNVGIVYQSHGAYGIGNDLHQVSWNSISLVKLDALNIQNVVEIFAQMCMYTFILIYICFKTQRLYIYISRYHYYCAYRIVRVYLLIFIYIYIHIYICIQLFVLDVFFSRTSLGSLSNVTGLTVPVRPSRGA